MARNRGSWLNRAAIWLGLSLVASAGAVALGGSGAAGAEVVYITPPATPTLTFQERVAPRRLSRREATPIALNLSGRIGTVDGSQPAALRQIAIDLDRHIGVDLRGLPSCSKRQRESRPSKLKSRCRKAIVGRGKVAFSIRFPEATPLLVKSELVVFNGGGHRAGKSSLYATAFLTVPIASVLTMKIAITKRRGQSQLTIEVPKLADGAGAMTALSLKLKKRFARNGSVATFLSGSCPNGRLESKVRALFADGTMIEGGSPQKCLPKSD